MLSIRVQFLSLQHIVPILLAILLFIVFVKVANKSSTSLKQQLIHYFALLVCFVMVSFHLYNIVIGTYNIHTDLPLFLCSFLGLIIPLFTYFRKFWMFEILVFWIIAGTAQGVITPDIPVGFPSFDYFRYWLVHLGLLIVIAYAITIFKMRPKFRSVFISFGLFQVYLLSMFFINKILNANYGYVNKKPDVASILDNLGNWPIYVFKADMLFFIGFLIIYFCFFISQKRHFT